MSTTDSTISPTESPRRPTSITVLAVLVVIVGVLTLIGSIVGIVGSAYLVSRQPDAAPTFWPGVGGLVVGLAYLAVAHGLLRGRPLARRLATLVAGLGLISSVLGLIFQTGSQRWASVVPALLAAGVLYLLHSADAKAFFRPR